MSSLNELFAELKSEIDATRSRGWGTTAGAAEYSLYRLDELINNGEFAREE